MPGEVPALPPLVMEGTEKGDKAGVVSFQQHVPWLSTV